MKPEENSGIGRQVKQRRKERNLTQQRLADIAGVDLRTIQRAEGGYGVGSENLAAIASALDLDERELRTNAAKAGPQPPEKRILLREVRSGKGLLAVLEQCKTRKESLRLGDPDEHPYNDMVGDDLLCLAAAVDATDGTATRRQALLRESQWIVSLSRKLGFNLFAGTDTEEVDMKGLKRRQKAMLVIAAPARDSRIVRTSKGRALDIVRDSRRQLLGGLLAGHCTPYNQLEHEFLSKSNGEERVKDAFRRIIAEVLAEIEQAAKYEEGRNEKP